MPPLFRLSPQILREHLRAWLAAVKTEASATNLYYRHLRVRQGTAFAAWRRWTRDARERRAAAAAVQRQRTGSLVRVAWARWRTAMARRRMTPEAEAVSTLRKGDAQERRGGRGEGEGGP